MLTRGITDGPGRATLVTGFGIRVSGFDFGFRVSGVTRGDAHELELRWALGGNRLLLCLQRLCESLVTCCLSLEGLVTCCLSQDWV